MNNGKLSDEVVWLRADEESEAYLAPADAPVESSQAQGRHDHRPLPCRLRNGADRQGAIHRRGAQPDGRRLGRLDSVPGARRRQPRADGLQHAAASRAAVGHRAADRGHGHGARRGPELGHDRARPPQGNGHLRRRESHRNRRRSLYPAQVRRPQRADLPEPEADRRTRPEGRKGRGDRRRRRHLSRASWPWAATCWSASWSGTASTSRTRSSSAKSW